MDSTKACGIIFEYEHLRFVAMFSTTRAGGRGGEGFHKGAIEHKVIMNLAAANGDKSVLRQWCRQFATALGRIGGAHEEIVRRLVKEVGLGK